jgi:crotonobetainyl-CoA:carnitine CoA-transferase CaiB-like acyl-CoA transferase
VHAIAARADVCCHNFRPGVAEKLDVDHARIKAVNPQIIYCGVDALGPIGPDAHRAGFDIIAQAAGGTMEPARTGLPMQLPIPIGDVTAMCLGALGVVAALFHRRVTGEGQEVRTSLLHAVALNGILRLVSIKHEDEDHFGALREGLRELAAHGASFAQMTETVNASVGGVLAPPGSGGGVQAEVYYRTYRTADGFIAIGCLNPRQQRRLNAALHLGDPRFDTQHPETQAPLAPEQIDALRARAEAIVATKTTAQWLTFLDAQSIACGPIRTMLDVLDSAHHRANEMLIEYDDPWVGPVVGLGYPIRFGTTPMQMQRPAPPTGDDTDEILRWLGRDAEEIAWLKSQRIVH